MATTSTKPTARLVQSLMSRISSLEKIVAELQAQLADAAVAKGTAEAKTALLERELQSKEDEYATIVQAIEPILDHKE